MINKDILIQDFNCKNYYEKFDEGIWDSDAQIQLILPADEIFIDPEKAFLVVGRPGVDGIEFGYRKGMIGFWIYYPIENRYEKAADQIEDFVDGWYSGKITV